MINNIVLSKHSLALAVMASSLVLSSEAAVAQDPTQQLNQQKQRIDALENKLDKILNLLEGSSPSAATSTAPVTSEAPIARQSVPTQASVPSAPVVVPTFNGMLMDIHVLKDLSQGIPDKPSGFNVATLEHNKGTIFSLNDMMKDKEVNHYIFNSAIGINWKGLVKINNAGEHLFSLNYSSSSGSWGMKTTCIASLGYGNSVVKSLNFRLGNESKSGQVILDLKPGYHNINIWFACNDINKISNSGKYTKQLVEASALKLRMKGPRDRKAIEIPTSRLGYF